MSLVQVRRDNGVALLTLADPGRRNVLSAALCATLSDAVASANADPSVKAIVVTGAAPAFCAGADLDDLLAASEGRTEAIHAVYKSFTDVANSAVPTIAAVNGAAVGAGMNLALACDVRLASDEASFHTRFMRLGLHPGGGHGWLLERAVGWAEASRLLLFGSIVRAEEALRIGLVQQVVPGGALLEAALSLAHQADETPRELLLRTKASLRLATRSDHAAAMAHETDEQFWSLGEPAFAELIARMRMTIARR